MKVGKCLGGWMMVYQWWKKGILRESGGRAYGRETKKEDDRNFDQLLIYINLIFNGIFVNKWKW